MQSGPDTGFILGGGRSWAREARQKFLKSTPPKFTFYPPQNDFSTPSKHFFYPLQIQIFDLLLTKILGGKRNVVTKHIYFQGGKKPGFYWVLLGFLKNDIFFI